MLLLLNDFFNNSCVYVSKMVIYYSSQFSSQMNQVSIIKRHYPIETTLLCHIVGNRLFKTFKQKEYFSRESDIVEKQKQCIFASECLSTCRLKYSFQSHLDYESTPQFFDMLCRGCSSTMQHSPFSKFCLHLFYIFFLSQIFMFFTMIYQQIFKNSK